MKKLKINPFGIPKNVFILGLVSFFNDVASEMIYPIIPLFLTGVLHAPVTIVGLIEGLAESTTSFMKLGSGWLSDRLHKRKPLIVIGYFLSTVSKAGLSLATIWPVALLARFSDKTGKGLRTPPRDALISASTDRTARGKSFGFHRSMDTAGAVVGPLIALLFLQKWPADFRSLFLWATVPGLIGVILLIIFVKEKVSIKSLKTAEKSSLSFEKLNPAFTYFLVISIIFAIGNSSDVFLILRSKQLGLTTVVTILLYVVFNISYALLAGPAGILSDKIGQRKVLLTSFFLFGLVYLLFGLVQKHQFLWILFPLYGFYMALNEGVGKAYIANLIPAEKLGTAFGLYQTMISLATFLSSVIAGYLWTYVSPATPFLFGSLTAFLAGLIFYFKK